MKKACKKNPGILKVILFTALCILCLANTKVYAAAENNETTDSAPAAGGNVVYSTENGTWEKVNDSTFTMDKDGDGTTDVTLVQNGDEWKYIFTVADDKATYYGWEENVPAGYEVIGSGTRAKPAVTSTTKYSHTPNISDDGVKNGNYANNLNLNDVVSIPGADKLHVTLTYGGESASYDYVCAWEGSQPTYTASNNNGSAISVNGTKKFGGGNGTTVEFDVSGDTVTFGYRSDGSGCGNGYGYYAVVTGSGGGLTITNKSKTNPAPETGAIELTKKVKGKSGAEKYAHTPNVNDDGVQNGNYANNLNLNDVVSIPGSTQLHVVLKYAGESVSYDYVCAWTGNHPEYTASGNYSSAISVNGTQKFGGGSGTTVEFDVEGDAVTFGYKSDSSGCGNGFGYYAVVTGNAGLGDKQYFKFNVKLSSDNADLTKLISGEKMYGDTVFKDGEGLVYLGGGDKAVIDGIPAGVNYTITEEPNEDYNVSWTGTAGSGNENTYSGAVEANVTHEIMCTNTYAKSTGGGSSTEHPAEYGVLKLTKQFVNITGDKNATLHIAFWNLDKNLSYKYSDGTSEKEFTSDATGMADVTLSVTDNQEFTFSDLPAGCKYQISEEAGDYISSYDVSGATQIAQQHGENFDVNKALTPAKETINKNDVAVVAFTNTGKETPKDEDKLVNVHVEKTWNDNDNAAGMRPDSITVQLTQDGDVVATATLDADTKWQADFTDLDKYAEDGTNECDYKVNEIDVPGYKSEIKTVSEDKTKSFTITNSIEDVGDLKVTKTVKGDGADLTQDFRFTVALEKDGKPLAGTFNLDGNKGTKTGTVAFAEDGTASFTLKHGESIYMKDIPAGVKWTVTEIVQSGYTEANNGKYSGSITKGKASTADVVNTYNPSHKVTVKKTVKGNQGDKTKQFKFQMSITGNGVPGNLAYAKNGKAGSVAVKNGIAEFTLGHKDVIVFKEVPEGVEYAVTELDGESNGYTVESKNASGTLNKDTEISFVNTKDVGVPTAAMTNTGAIAGVVMAGVIGIMAIVILKRKKRSEK